MFFIGQTPGLQHVRRRLPAQQAGLALTLLVLWIFADDANYTVATNHLAVTANLLNRSTYFHDFYSVLWTAASAMGRAAISFNVRYS